MEVGEQARRQEEERRGEGEKRGEVRQEKVQSEIG